jgi:hypothetical protein
MTLIDGNEFGAKPEANDGNVQFPLAHGLRSRVPDTDSAK